VSARERDTVTLFRPVGLAELELVRQSGWKEFPPRLPAQPIFYPVLNQDYAAQIAREWNSRDASHQFVGFVLRFAVDAPFLARYEVHRVGGRGHDEYWIPAAELREFNDNIIGRIELVAKYERGASVPLDES
jgi:hypothetical protein